MTAIFRFFDRGKKGEEAYPERMSKPYRLGEPYVHFENDVIPISFIFVKDTRFVPCQYTGLDDKNNHMIFEYDILYNEEEGMTGDVRFIDGCFKTEARGFGLEAIEDGDDFIITGNILGR